MVTIITPYLHSEEVVRLKNEIGLFHNCLFRKDNKLIGSDLMYQKLWKEAAPDDIFIMHADMSIGNNENWMEDILKYVKKYPEAGMFGCKLIYPPESTENKKIIQSAGGKFTDENETDYKKIRPDHFGGGVNLLTGKVYKNSLEEDLGQYDKVREVAWTTFGGVYIRREVINDVGDFDPDYEWSYNRDVDYCLEARKHGWKIYQIPVTLIHFESADNNRLRSNNPELNNKEYRNLKRLQNKWHNNSLFSTINIEIN